MKTKANYLVVPVALGVVTIVTIILAIVKFGWYYYLIGALVGLMNHGLLLKQSYRIERYAKLDPEGKTLNPKRTALIWFLLRVLVLAAVFAALIYKATPWTDSNGIWYIILAVIGYTTIKVIFIIFLLISKKKVIEEWYLRTP